VRRAEMRFGYSSISGCATSRQPMRQGMLKPLRRWLTLGDYALDRVMPGQSLCPDTGGRQGKALRRRAHE